VPHQEIHPDLCVALGAGILAGRLAGEDIEQVLVDISPYSFGPSYLGELNGELSTDCYHPIIQRNLPLPVTRTDRYTTSAPYQTMVNIDIYQGEDPDARKNTFIGNFSITGLTPMEEPNEILCRMKLDINGVLHVEAIEKETGKSKKIIIKNAFTLKSKKQMAAVKNRIEELFSTRVPDAELEEVFDRFEGDNPESAGSSQQRDSIAISNAGTAEGKDDGSEAAPADSQWKEFESEANRLVERIRNVLSKMHNEDKEEAIELEETMLEAIRSKDASKLSSSMQELKELLFFVEGS
jgi:molecular chaperone DnaK (HSP70)